jgi:hypothetical protein
MRIEEEANNSAIDQEFLRLDVRLGSAAGYALGLILLALPTRWD